MGTPGEDRIDSLGDGNCGYSAYACSLMAYLRFHREVRKTVFKNLALAEEIITQLTPFLDDQKPWTDPDWKKIASLLREPLRNVAAIRTAEILKKWAKDPHSLLCQEYAYTEGATSALQMTIEREKNQTKISNNDRHDIDRVKEIVNGIKIYLKNNESLSITDDNIVDHAATFLKQNDYYYIKIYEEYLKKNGTWISYETLGLLHKVAFNDCDEQPQTEITHENTRKTARKLGIYDNTEQKIRIINERYRHWVSYIPSEFLIKDTEEQSHTSVTKHDAAQTTAPVPSFFQSATRLGKTLAEQPVLVPVALVTTFLLCCGAIATGITSVMGAFLLCIAAISLAATLALTVNQIYECSFRNKV